jgi:hypothetical protein
MMPEGLTDAIEWIKTNPKVFVPAALLFLVLGFLAGRWFVYADTSHIHGDEAYEGVAAIQRSLDDAALKKQAVNEFIAAKCERGELPDSPSTCAKALGAIEAANSR